MHVYLSDEKKNLIQMAISESGRKINVSASSMHLPMISNFLQQHTYMHIYIYIYMHVVNLHTRQSECIILHFEER